MIVTEFRYLSVFSCPQYTPPQPGNHVDGHVTEVPPRSKKQPDGYYLIYSPDDDVSSSEDDQGEYDEDEEDEPVCECVCVCECACECVCVCECECVCV